MVRESTIVAESIERMGTSHTIKYKTCCLRILGGVELLRNVATYRSTRRPAIAVGGDSSVEDVVPKVRRVIAVSAEAKLIAWIPRLFKKLAQSRNIGVELKQHVDIAAFEIGRLG